MGQVIKLVIYLFKLKGKFLLLSSLKTYWDESYFTVADIHQNPDDGDFPWKAGFLETTDVAVSPRWFYQKRMLLWSEAPQLFTLQDLSYCNDYRIWAKLMEIKWTVLDITFVDFSWKKRGIYGTKNERTWTKHHEQENCVLLQMH
jgi:hypothetical protein